MMGIPPSQPPGGSGRSDSTGRSSGPDRKKLRKDFRLPEKGERESGEERKKGLFDLTQKEKKEAAEIEALENRLSQEKQIEKESEVKETAKIAQTEAKEIVAKITALIQTMASKLQVGVVQGMNTASMALKGGAEVPEAFANTTLTLTQTDKGIVVNFSNFDSLQQQQAAVNAIEQNREALAQMVQNLQTKNIQLAQLQIGDQMISLPQPLPSVSPVERTATTETLREREEEPGEDEGEDSNA